MTASTNPPRVLLIGASRGIGLALAREWAERGATVTATVRGTSRTALHDLRDSAPNRIEIELVDIAEPEQVQSLHDALQGRTFDVLLVNAGVTNDPQRTVADVPTDEFTRLMVTNALSPMRFIEVFGDLVEADGTIAIMSSGQGSIANNTRGGFEIYRASKSALNQLMRSYAARHVATKRTLLLTAPGWIRDTGVGGPDAPLTIEDSIPALVSTIEQQCGRPGLQFLDYQGRTVPW